MQKWHGYSINSKYHYCYWFLCIRKRLYKRKDTRSYTQVTDICGSKYWVDFWSSYESTQSLQIQSSLCDVVPSFGTHGKADAKLQIMEIITSSLRWPSSHQFIYPVSHDYLPHSVTHSLSCPLIFQLTASGMLVVVFFSSHAYSS